MFVATMNELPTAAPPGSLLSRIFPVAGLSARISVGLGVQSYPQRTKSGRAWAPANRQRAMAAAYRRFAGYLIRRNSFLLLMGRGKQKNSPCPPRAVTGKGQREDSEG